MKAAMKSRIENAKFSMNELVYLNAGIPSEVEQAHVIIAELIMAKADLEDMGACDSFIALCGSRVISAMNKFNY